VQPAIGAAGAAGARRVCPEVLAGAAHADEPAVVIDALDHVSVQLELRDDGGRERDPAGVQLRKPTGCSPASRRRSSSRCCWTSASVIDGFSPSSAICGRLERFQAALLPPDVWRLRVLARLPAASRRSRLTRSAIVATDVATLPTPPRRARARVQRAVGDQREQQPLYIHSRTVWARAPCELEVDPRRPTARRAAIPRPAAATTTSNSPDAPGQRYPAAINVGEPGDRRRHPAQSLAGSRHPSRAGMAQRARRSRPCAPRADPSSR
jgi:hypothetical protein